MAIADVPVEARAVVLARRRKALDELDVRRGLRELQAQGHTQRDIARWVGIAQPSVAGMLKTAEKVEMPVEGFSGATPYEICERYSAGFMDRAQLVDELTRFPYVKGDEADEYDSLVVDPAGTWSEVSDARRRGLIEDDVYEEVFDRRHGIEVPAKLSVPEMKMLEATAGNLFTSTVFVDYVAGDVARALTESFKIVVENGGYQLDTISGSGGGEVTRRANGTEINVRGRDGQIHARGQASIDRGRRK